MVKPLKSIVKLTNFYILRYLLLNSAILSLICKFYVETKKKLQSGLGCWMDYCLTCLSWLQ